jgi:hypothetical protein
LRDSIIGPVSTGLLHELDDPGLVGRGQLDDAERRGEHRPVIDPRRVLEAEGRVAGVELRLRLEEADDLPVASPGGHAVPGLRIERGGSLGDELGQSLGHRSVLRRERRDLLALVAFAIGSGVLRLLLGLQLADALAHRGLLVGAEALAIHVGLAVRLLGGRHVAVPSSVRR